MIKDMTHGSESKNLLFFAFPIVISSMFQQFYNIADSMIAGQFAGVNALAAIGASYQVTLLFLAIATGSGAGASVVVSRFFGAKQFALVKSTISTAIISVIGLGIITSVLGAVFCPYLLQLLQTPDNIMDDSILYLNIYVVGIIFLLLYNMGTSIFTGLGDSRTPLYFLIFSTLLNIGLDVLFIKEFEWGVFGAAIATFIAQSFSSIGLMVCLIKRIKKIKVCEPYKKFDPDILKSISIIAIPSILQQATVAVGQLCIQSLINSYGTEVVAGYSAAIKIDTFFKYTALSMSTAMTNFTAQNLGANKPERIKKGRHSAYISMAIYFVFIAIIVMIFKENLIGFFVDSNSNATVIEVGANYLSIVSLFYIPFALLVCNSGAMRGAGLMFGFTFSTLLDLVIRVIMSYVLAGIIGFSAIWWSIPIGWVISMFISFSFFYSKKWKSIIASHNQA